MCSRTKIPQVPGMTSQETAALDAQKANIGKMETMGGQYGNVMQTVSGLFNPDGTINQTALQNFGTQMQGYYGSQQGVYDTALAQGQLEDQIYRQALAGTAPVSEGLKQQKQRDFEVFKQAAGQRGIKIQGDSFDNATSSSTAGIRMLSEAQKRYDLAADNERNALRQWGSTQSLNRMGALGSYNPYAAQMGNFNNATMGMMPVLSGINQQWSGYMQPYQQQRMTEFNRDTAQAQADAAWKNSMWQGGGQLLGTGAGMAMMAMGNPAGAPLAMGAGKQGAFQGSYNQFAANTGADPNQYMPSYIRNQMMPRTAGVNGYMGGGY